MSAWQFGQVNLKAGTSTVVVVCITLALFVVVCMLVVGQYLSLWLQAALSGCRVGFFHIIAMRLRKVDPRVVVYGCIRVEKAGLTLGPAPERLLEEHARAGGRVGEVVSSMIKLKGAGVSATWDKLAAADLLGCDVLQAAEVVAKSKAAGSSVSLESALAGARVR